VDSGFTVLHIHSAALPAELPHELTEQIRSVALRAATAVQLSDHGRIDFRVRNSDNAIFVLEANPNPDISLDSGSFEQRRPVEGSIPA
jgi:D-alanine-D-alanine ligase-like ATP-grasp enzyme